MIVEELWVYPVKGCQGISVPEARLTATGLEYDRALCIVDTEGLVVAKNEAISMRKIPALATIQVEYLNSQREILLTGGDGESIKLPLNEKDYVMNDDIVVSCSGKSTTTGGGWSLGTIPCKLGDRKANDWITAYLNHQDKNGKFRHGKSLRTSFAFARSVSTLQLRNYPEIFPIISAAKADGRLGRNEKRFSDFAPLLICNRASLERVKSLGNVKDYPMESMRASIIVDSKQSWSEERWKYIYVQGNNKEPLTLSKIKECPRCTVPCRHPKTGKYLFPEKLLLWKVLKKAFPQKVRMPISISSVKQNHLH
mmetsp:Transcript_4081/g.5012  ORF Transcript_4081/g.5012 Transcript_4081/m.5012 type:complete len:311 (+) Transcript_4081:41-973(+)